MRSIQGSISVSVCRRLAATVSLALSVVLVSAVVATTAARAQSYNETILYNFDNVGNDGNTLPAGPVLDPKGNLYGVTTNGGNVTCAALNDAGCGELYKLDTNNNLTVVYVFKGGKDGSLPDSSLVWDEAGNLYGTTLTGGDASCPQGAGWGCGVVFKLTPDANGGWKETVLHRFTGKGDGALPNANGAGGLTLDAAGNLYGTAVWGGVINSLCVNGCGTVYKIDKNDNFTVLYKFKGPYNDAKIPWGTLAMDSTGDLFGITFEGGTYNVGTVFEITAGGKEKVLYSFPEFNSMTPQPFGGLVLDSKDNLYGVTWGNGLNDCLDYGCGQAFEITSGGQFTPLWTFSEFTDGGDPLGALTLDSQGNLIGVNSQGGIWPNNLGNVYKLTKNGNLKVLYAFTPTTGSHPIGSIVMDKAGNVYGATQVSANTTSCSAGYHCGAIYKLTPP